MPTSLIFVALAAVWLVVLVPLVAKRRQEVVRTTDAALAARVLRRPGTGPWRGEHEEEVPVDSDREDRVQAWDEHEVEQDESMRPFRPGRGGYDPEAAALAAQARYAFRQRVVVALLAAAVGTLLLALVSSSAYWWFHGVFDLTILGYLAYLRRQVRIEEEVRQRRANRQPNERRRAPAAGRDEDSDEEEDEIAPAAPHPPEAAPSPALTHPTAVAVDLDDEDPDFDDLAPSFEPPYRRAAGE